MYQLHASPHPGAGRWPAASHSTRQLQPAAPFPGRTRVVTKFRSNKKGDRSASGSNDQSGIEDVAERCAPCEQAPSKAAAEVVVASAAKHPKLHSVVPPGSTHQTALDTAELEPPLPPVEQLLTDNLQPGNAQPSDTAGDEGGQVLQEQEGRSRRGDLRGQAPAWALSTPSTAGIADAPVGAPSPGSSMAGGKDVEAAATPSKGSSSSAQGGMGPSSTTRNESASGAGVSQAVSRGEVDATSEEMRESAGVDDAHLQGRAPPPSPSPVPDVPVAADAGRAGSPMEGDEDDALYEAQVSDLQSSSARGKQQQQQSKQHGQDADTGQQQRRDVQAEQPAQQGSHTRSAEARMQAVLHEMEEDFKEEGAGGPGAAARGLDWQLLQDQDRTVEPGHSAALQWPYDPLKQEQQEQEPKQQPASKKDHQERGGKHQHEPVAAAKVTRGVSTDEWRRSVTSVDDSDRFPNEGGGSGGVQDGSDRMSPELAQDKRADARADIPADALQERISDPGLDEVTSPTEGVRSNEHGQVQDNMRGTHRQRQLELAQREQEEAQREALEKQHQHQRGEHAHHHHGLRARNRAEAEAEVQELVHHPDEMIAEMQHESWGAGVFPEYVHALAEAAAEAEKGVEQQQQQSQQQETQEPPHVTAARQQALSAFRSATGQDSSSFLSSLNSPRIRSQSPAEDAVSLAAARHVPEARHVLREVQHAADHSPSPAPADLAEEARKQQQAPSSRVVSHPLRSTPSPSPPPQEEPDAAADAPTSSGDGSRSSSAEPMPLNEALQAAAEALQREQEDALQAGSEAVGPAESSSLLAGAQPRLSPDQLASEARLMLLEAMGEEVRAVRGDIRNTTRLLKDMKKALLFVQQNTARLPAEMTNNLQQSILQEMARLEVEVASAEAGMTSLSLAMSHLQRGGPVPALQSVDQYMQYIEGMAETLAEGSPGVAKPSLDSVSELLSMGGPGGEESEGAGGKSEGRSHLAKLVVQGAEVIRDELEASLKTGAKGDGPAGETHSADELQPEGDEGAAAAAAAAAASSRVAVPKPKPTRLGRRLLAMATKRFGPLVSHHKHHEGVDGDTATALQLGLVPAAGAGTAHDAASKGDTAAEGSHSGDGTQQPSAAASTPDSDTPASGTSAAASSAGSSDAGMAASGGIPLSSSDMGLSNVGDSTFKAASKSKLPPAGNGGGGGSLPPLRPTAEGAGEGGDRPASPLVSWLVVACMTVGLATGSWQAARHLRFGSPVIGQRHEQVSIAMVAAEPAEAAAAEAAAAAQAAGIDHAQMTAPSHEHGHHGHHGHHMDAGEDSGVASTAGSSSLASGLAAALHHEHHHQHKDH